MKYAEQKKRSFIKSVTYRVLIIIATGVVTWITTKRWDITVEIVSATSIVNTILYYVHERIWNSISWGK